MPVTPFQPESEVSFLLLKLRKSMQCSPGKAALWLCQLHNAGEQAHSGKRVKVELLITLRSESPHKGCKDHMEGAHNGSMRTLIW